MAASDAELGWWQVRTVPGDAGRPTPLVAGKSVAPDEVISLPADALFFAHGSAALAPDVGRLIDDVAAALISAGFDVVVVGHTDSDGSDDYNLALGQARADVVADQLRHRGVNDSQLVAIVSDGERCPIADNDTGAGRAANRRVDLVPATGLSVEPAACPTRSIAADSTEGR